MELDSAIEPTIGPYEVYEDEWFNDKAAFEAFIIVRDADVFDVCRCPRPDPRGISETPAEAEAEVRRLVVRAVAGRAARSAGEP
jgi:hypothetical protein